MYLYLSLVGIQEEKDNWNAATPQPHGPPFCVTCGGPGHSDIALVQFIHGFCDFHI